MQLEIFEAITKELKEGKQIALVTIHDTVGSTPGRAGFLMAIRTDGSSIGTVGGGRMEHILCSKALECIAKGSGEDFSYDLSASGELGMICGGKAEGTIQVFGNSNKLVIFGGGHVSQKTARIFENLSFSVYVIDEREDLKENFSTSVNYISLLPSEGINKIPCDQNTYFVVTTRGHSGDIDALKAIYHKPHAYIGVIGSKRKVVEVKKTLSLDKISNEWLNSLYAPIGLDISDGTAEEIAVSIAGQILCIKNKKEPTHLCNRVLLK